MVLPGSVMSPPPESDRSPGPGPDPGIAGTKQQTPNKAQTKARPLLEKPPESHDPAPKDGAFELNPTPQLPSDPKEGGSEREEEAEPVHSSQPENRVTENPKPEQGLSGDDSPSAANEKNDQSFREKATVSNKHKVSRLNRDKAEFQKLDKCEVFNQKSATRGSAHSEAAAVKERDNPNLKEHDKCGPTKGSKSKLPHLNQMKVKQTAPEHKDQIYSESSSAKPEENRPDGNLSENSAPKVLNLLSAEPEKPDDAASAEGLRSEPTAVTGPDPQSSPPDLMKPSLPRARLHGYLLKRGGALKAWKQRWFVFDEKQNALVYSRTPRDVTPLGKVPLSQATFTCEGAEPGVFYLHTPERTVTLKAQSEELKFFWLQQLQLKRWIYKLSPDSKDSQHDHNKTGAELFPLLQTGEGVDTEETVSRPFLLQLSLKHPFIELQNSLLNLRKRSNDWSQSVFHVQALPTGLKPANQSAAETPTNQSATETPTNPSAAETPTNQSAAETPTNQSAAEVNSTIRSSSSNSTQAPPPTAETPPTNLPLVAAPLTSTPAGHMTIRRMSQSFLRRNTASLTEPRLQQELQDQKDLVSILQKALEASQSERKSWRRFLSEEDLVRLERIRTLEDQVQDLRQHLDQTQVQLQDLKTSQNQKDRLIQDLQDEVRDLSEKNQVKQQVIMKLSDSVSNWTEQSSVVDLLSVQTLVQQNQQLRDDIEAFQNQNQFLNSEIHQLSRLWRTSTETQRGLMAKAALLEACNCELRVQYLKVLRQLQDIHQGDMAQRESVQRLIEAALKPDQNQVQVQVHRELDQYGFQLVPDFEVEDIKLLSKIQALELRSHNLNQEGLEHPLVARWQQYMSGCRGELSPSPELKTLIRAGVPPDLRPQIWNWIIRTRTQKDQDPQRYQQLCEQIQSGSQSGSRPWFRQIDLDLPRTLCTNQNFSSPSSPALQQLRRILLAFSWENPEIGYCQGLNRLAALVLLVLGSEEDSFWGLKAVVENIMPQDYYTASLIASQADQLVLKDFLWEKLPRLAAHLDRCEVDLSMATFSWFLVAFVEILPSDLLLPLWDAFLYEGSKVLFRYSLALFKLKEAEILQLSSSVQIYQYLRVFTKTVSDHRKLASVAFTELNPFSRRALRNRRAVHLERLRGDLCDLQRQQSLFLSQRRDKSTEDGEMEALDQHSDDEFY